MNFGFAKPRCAVAVLGIALLSSILIGTSSQAQTYTDLHDFNPSKGDPVGLQYSGLIPQGRDGNLYGSSHSGGTSGTGTIYKIAAAGTPTVLVSANTTTGTGPYNGLNLGTDGNFYGSAQFDGSAGFGTLFKVTPTGTLTVLHNFTDTGDGAYPVSAPVQGSDGNFYGTTGGNSLIGSTVFYKLTPTGTFTTLHSFAGPEGNACSGLIVGSDGNFYGGCNLGGANNMGALIKVSVQGVVTVLHSFSGPDGSDAAGSFMLQATDGNFYGVTFLGGSSNQGVFYQLKPNGTYTVLHNFTGGVDGGNPTGGPVQGPDGKFYGVTANGGNAALCSAGCGVIYKITTTGVFTVLHSFDLTHGAQPESNLTLRTDGLLYGTTFNGGANTAGAFYSLTVAFSPFVSLVTTSGKETAKIGILGQGFTAATVVSFGGVKATSIVRTGATFITATVPAAALSGAVTATTGSTILTSKQTFKVKPTFTSFSPSSGVVGTPVLITGTGLTQALKVTFGGVAATTVTVNSDTQITADVPAGAITGRVAITTKGGSVTSTTTFTVN